MKHPSPRYIDCSTLTGQRNIAERTHVPDDLNISRVSVVATEYEKIPILMTINEYTVTQTCLEQNAIR